MPDWKRVKITFPTEKLGKYIEPVKRTVSETSGKDYHTVYGVTNTEGIAVTGKKASKDISNYITVDEGCFAYNPYRINVGSIGFNDSGKKGCVSPAYVVFKTRGDFSPEFLFLYLKSDFGNHLINWYGNRGGVRNALRYDDLCEIDVPIIDYQKQIVLLKKIQRTKTMVTQFDSGIDDQLVLLKKLRQQVLQEAIEGKLTADWRRETLTKLAKDTKKNLCELRELREKDPEYSAKALLEKIKAEKEVLTKNTKRTKKEKPIAPITDEEKPFDLPAGWMWCRFGELCKGIFTGPFGSMLHKSDYVQNGIPVVNPTHIIDGKIISDGRMCISEKTKQRLKRYSLRSGDLVVARRGDLSKFAVVTPSQEGWLCGTGSFFIRGLNVDKIFIRLAYVSQKAQAYLLQDSIGQTMDNLNQKLLRKLPIGLPPHTEQHAIVERVDKIMAMIDDLEKQVAERKGQSEMLMQSVLSEAFNAHNKETKKGGDTYA